MRFPIFNFRLFYGTGAKTPTSQSPTEQIQISHGTVYLDLPRTYTKQLSRFVRGVITTSDSIIYRIYGDLHQKDGKCVGFDPRRCADKILEPSLLPLVEEFSRTVIAMDSEWRKTVSEFTDKKGRLWKLAE